MVEKRLPYRYAITFGTVLCIGEMALFVVRITMLGEFIGSTILLVTMVFAMLTGFLHPLILKWEDEAVCVATSVVGLAWFILSLVIFVAASKPIRSHSSGFPIVAVWGPWLSGFLANLMSCLLWIEFGMAVFFHRRSLKDSGNGQSTKPQNTMLAEPHTKWLLGLILASMIMSFILFGLSFGDGAYGAYGIWLILVAAVLTELLHTVTIPVWAHTVKKRQGTTIPPFIYSITLIILTSLLATLWFSTGIVSVLVVTHKLDNTKYITWPIFLGPGTLLPYIRRLAAALALVMSFLLWTQLWLIVHYRIRFSRQVKQAIKVSESVVPPNPINPPFNPPNGLGPNPVHPFYPTYPPPSIHIHPMLQKDEGR